jgi:hypothetical protein
MWYIILGYKVEEKLYLGVREQKKVKCHWNTVSAATWGSGFMGGPAHNASSFQASCSPISCSNIEKKLKRLVCQPRHGYEFVRTNLRRVPRTVEKCAASSQISSQNRKYDYEANFWRYIWHLPGKRDVITHRNMFLNSTWNTNLNYLLACPNLSENIRHALLQELVFDLIWFARMNSCVGTRTWIFKFSLNQICKYPSVQAVKTCFWLVGLLGYNTVQSRTLLATFRRILLHLTFTLKMEAVSFSETSITTYNTTHCQNPHVHNLKSCPKHINFALLFFVNVSEKCVFKI